MLRGYRGIVVAFGLVLIGAGEPPKASTQPDQRQARQEVSNASRSVLQVRNVEIAPEQDVGCRDKKDERGSDLCTQWKAADAARDTANYALAGIWLGLLGTVLIVATFWETRKTSRLELRAYITHQDTTTFYFETAGVLDKIQFTFAWKNSGPTPATRIRVSHNRHWFAGSSLPADFAFPDINPVSPLHPGRHLGPGLIMEADIMVPLIDLRLDERGSTFFYGWVEYDDIYRKRRRSEFCSELRFLGDPKVSQSPLRLPHRGPFNGMDDSCYRTPQT